MDTIVLRADEPGAIERAAEMLRARKLVAFPTDTVYGLGALAFDAEGVAALYRAKDRPSERAIAVLVADKPMVDLVAEHIPDVARRLMDKFWPGALTLIVPKRSRVPDLLSGGSTIGVRLPAFDLTRRLLTLTGPLAVTSANRSGQPAPRSAAGVLEQLESRIHAVLDGGVTEGTPSTVVDCSRLPPSIVRSGPITEEQLRVFTRLA
jgi:L-threonylcarbamoyladenylate synthase